MSDIIAAIAGGAIGAAGAAIGFIYKRRLDTISILRESLYRLLELYGSVKRSILPTLDQQIEWYLEVANEVFPEEKILEKKDEAKAVMIPLITKATSQILQEAEDGLLVEYRKTIEKLAPLSPLLAQRLNANTALKAALSQIDIYYKNVTEMYKKGITIGKNDAAILDISIEIVRARITQDVVSELKRDVLWCALLCGLFPLISIAYRFYIKREEPLESILKREYRMVLLDIRKKGEAHIASQMLKE